jgi:hypothetical protein
MSPPGILELWLSLSRLVAVNAPSWRKLEGNALRSPS